MMTLQEVARALGGEVCGNQVRAPGPGHNPQDRSLTVKLEANAPDGFIVHTFSPRDDPLHAKDYVRAKLGLPHWNGNAGAQGEREVAAYNYTDEHGSLLFQVVRFHPKQFRQRRPNGSGSWKWSVKGVRRVLYRLPQVIEAVTKDQVIFICEGEKAADALVKIGVIATCNPGGAGKWRTDCARFLKGAHVVVLPDNDEAGREHARQVATSLCDLAASVKILELPDFLRKVTPMTGVQLAGPPRLSRTSPRKPRQRPRSPAKPRKAPIGCATASATTRVGPWQTWLTLCSRCDPIRS